MTSPPPARSHEDRVLVHARLSRDVELTCQYLHAAQISAQPCATPADLCARLEEGAAVVLVDESVVRGPGGGLLRQALASQPAWSDIPLVVLAADVNALDDVLEELGPVANILVIEVPARRRTLLSVVRMALRARKRQYDTRDLLLLTEVDRRKTAFLATLSHELRNPLATIRSAQELIARVGSPELQVQQTNAIIGRQVRSLARMVDDLLDVSRVVAGKLRLESQRVDLNEVVERAVAARRLVSDLSDRSITFSPSPRPVVVMGDPVRLEQVVANLLDNAIKYTVAGSQIRLWAEGEGPCRIGIRDDGLGIDAEVLPHIFEIFVQEATSLSRSRGGLGLGLSLVKGLVSLHGGTVTVASEGPGTGSLFVVTLPAAPALPDTDTPPQDPLHNPISTLRGRRLLLVDDNVDLLSLVRELFELDGAIVEVARDGHEGVARALAFQPELALIDIGLPGLDGYEVASRIREALGSASVLIAMTGFGQLEDRRRALQAGFDEHVVKPVDTQLLAALLTRLDAR